VNAVTHDPEQNPGGGADDDEAADGAEDRDRERPTVERPTVTPSFDPAEFAKQAQLRPSPARGVPAPGPHARKTQPGLARPLAPTLTDPVELEAARQLSLQSNPAPRKATPAGALSLANARIPSNLPPPPAKGEPPRPREAEPPPSSGTPASDEPPSAREMEDRVAVGDYTGALAMAERLLALDPDDQAAATCAESCRTILRQMYTARIGPLDKVPVVLVSRDQMRWLSIDHRAGFVLSLVDGVSSFEMILDVSGMPELDALRILGELSQQRIIGVR
jgi:hypothetical protein